MFLLLPLVYACANVFQIAYQSIQKEYSITRDVHALLNQNCLTIIRT